MRRWICGLALCALVCAGCTTGDFVGNGEVVAEGNIEGNVFKIWKVTIDGKPCLVTHRGGITCHWGHHIP